MARWAAIVEEKERSSRAPVRHQIVPGTGVKIKKVEVIKRAAQAQGSSVSAVRSTGTLMSPIATATRSRVMKLIEPSSRAVIAPAARSAAVVGDGFGHAVGHEARGKHLAGAGNRRGSCLRPRPWFVPAVSPWFVQR